MALASPSPASPAPEPRKSVSVALLGATALAPALAILAYDTVSRRELFLSRAGPPIEGYVGGAILSMAVWGLALEAARHPRAPVRVAACVILGLTAGFGIGGQLLFRSITHGYYNRDAALFSVHLWPTIGHYLAENPAGIAATLLGPAALAIGYALVRGRIAGAYGSAAGGTHTSPSAALEGAQRPPRARRQLAHLVAGLALVAWGLATFGPFHVPAQKTGLPPEMLFWHAAGGLGLYAIGILPKPKTLPPGQHTTPPPPARPVLAAAPSVVLIFGESVRRDEVCAQKSPDCTKSPRLDAAAPGRIGFRHSFSVASCTEIASAILWTGLAITSEPEAMQATPLLWDYAKARGYRTAYLASQNLAFGGQGLFVENSLIDEKREARDRIAHPDYDIGSPDEQTAAEALEFLAKAGPAFVVMHFSNTHLPYRQVPGLTPYAAEGQSNADRRARYLNSLVHHDATIGHFIEELRRTEHGKSTIVVYSADHGEAWGEHDSYSHTFDLYAEQIDVPLWIDAPDGTLSEAQRRELQAGADSRPVFTPDVSATLLDLMGALDEPAFSDLTNKLAGTSVLRPRPAQKDMELSNCPPFRGCFPDAWGTVRWPLKYHYVGRDSRSACANVESDPTEQSPLPIAACEELRRPLAARHGAPPDRAVTPSPSASNSL
jgi:hypothetical protein